MDFFITSNLEIDEGTNMFCVCLPIVGYSKINKYTK